MIVVFVVSALLGRSLNIISWRHWDSLRDGEQRDRGD